MLADSFCERISDDWLWREKDLREMDRVILRSPKASVLKSGILITYSHWEGHFKTCASETLSFISEGVKRKIFGWCNIRAEVRQRILFCSYRRASLAGQNQETFMGYLNALNDNRYAQALSARDEVIMVDDNLNSARAEAICRNLGVDPSWFVMKKVVIDERLLEFRNAIAHGSRRLRNGDEIEVVGVDVEDTLSQIRGLIRETKTQFQNAIIERRFLDS